MLRDGGEVAQCGEPPRVTLKVNDVRTAATLARPSPLSLAQAYIEGRAELEGGVREAIRSAEALSGTRLDRLFDAGCCASAASSSTTASPPRTCAIAPSGWVAASSSTATSSPKGEPPHLHRVIHHMSAQDLLTRDWMYRPTFRAGADETPYPYMRGLRGFARSSAKSGASASIGV